MLAVSRDSRVSWLERIEMRCAQQWAAAYKEKESRATIIASSAGTPVDDEADWRRAWMTVLKLK